MYGWNRAALPKWSSLLVFVLVLSLLAPAWPAAAAPEEGGVLAPPDVTDSVYVVSQDESVKLRLDYINDKLDNPPPDGYIALFTSGANVTNTPEPDRVLVKEGDVAIRVDASGKVLKVNGPDADPPTAWDPDEIADIPAGGYVVLAHDPDWTSSTRAKPLFLGFREGDTITLTRGGVPVTAGDFLPKGPGITLETPSGTTVVSPVFDVRGNVANAAPGMRLTVNEEDAVIAADGSFVSSVFLQPGENTVTVRLWDGETAVASASLTVTYDNSAVPGDYIEVEAAPIDITIGVNGPRKQINIIDQDVSGIDNILALFTRDFGASITVPQFNVAVQVDADNRVLRVVNPSVNGNPPVWTGPTELDIPEGGYVLFGQDNSYNNVGIKKYLAVHFKPGDIIKLRKNGEVVSVRDLMSGTGPKARLTVDNRPMYTVTDSATNITGSVTNVENMAEIAVTVNGAAAAVAADGTFSHVQPLSPGTNYIDVVVTRNGDEQDRTSLVVFSRPDFAPDKDVILWVDQASNARKFQTSQQVYDFLVRAKETGITDIAFDVKGVEGFASYKKNDLTGRPYVSEIKAPEKAGSNPDLDLLEEFLTHGHALGLKVHAAINVFAEGSIASNEFAVLDQHPDWEERVYMPENNGEIKRLRESARMGLVAFVNPANDEVRDYELKTFEEVIKNYDVDGVIHDRGRYDNETADFSDETRAKFEAFLQARGKQLTNWPTDIFRYENGTRVDGPLIQDWWEFRSATIKSFFGEVKALVDRYEQQKGKTIQVSSYVGSWYETYYLNGVNWASPNFRYDPRLGLGSETVYTPSYYETGYIEHLDFLMIGAYQRTGPEVEKYITLGNIVTNGEIPLYAGIALTNIQAPELQREVFQSGLRTTNGLMLFDASQINWAVAAAALRDEEYVKDYQLGMSLPDRPDDFLEGNYYNVNLVVDNINVMTDAFGPTTGTNRFGVEVVVDATGAVTRVANRRQAIDWSWGNPEENNSPIPLGGFVISTLDTSGTRTLRQLVAQSYEIGDQVRSAALRGFLDYDGKQTTASELTLKGQVEVLGPGEAAVTVNGQPAEVADNGQFTAAVPLELGSNAITIEVRVDQFKTNSKTITVIRTESGGGDDGGGDDGGGDDGGGDDGGGDDGGGDDGGGDDGGGYIPTIPILPDDMTIRHETGADGRYAAIADIDADYMMKEIDRLAQLDPSEQKLEYEIDSDALTIKANLPASGLRQAIADIPEGIIVLKTPLGRYELPVAALKDALAANEQADALQWSIASVKGWLAEDIAERIAADGGTAAGAAVDVGLKLLTGKKEEAIPRFNGHYAVLVQPLTETVDPAAATAVSYGADGGLAFVPSTFGTDGDGSAVRMLLSGGGIYTVAAFNKSFADLRGHWVEEAASALASRLIVEGVGESRFAPDEPLTRAQFAALLVRALGLPGQAADTAFRDVQPGDWYAEAAGAAVQAGLVEGDASGNFRPNDRLTREQMSVMLVRALAFANASPSGGSTAAVLQRFADRDALSSWSRDAAAAVVKAGLMEGKPNGRFAPQGTATRAEGTAVLMRLLQYLHFIGG